MVEQKLMWSNPRIHRPLQRYKNSLLKRRLAIVLRFWNIVHETTSSWLLIKIPPNLCKRVNSFEVTKTRYQSIFSRKQVESVIAVNVPKVNTLGTKHFCPGRCLPPKILKRRFTNVLKILSFSTWKIGNFRVIDVRLISWDHYLLNTLLIRRPVHNAWLIFRVLEENIPTVQPKRLYKRLTKDIRNWGGTCSWWFSLG